MVTHSRADNGFLLASIGMFVSIGRVCCDAVGRLTDCFSSNSIALESLGGVVDIGCFGLRLECSVALDVLGLIHTLLTLSVTGYTYKYCLQNPKK